MPDLIEAVRAAISFVEEELRARIDSHTTNGDISTADEAGAAVINEAQIVLDDLRAAVADPYPTRIILDLSTAHLCDKAVELLDEWADTEHKDAVFTRGTALETAGARFRTHLHQDGWTILVPWDNKPGEHDEEETDLPESLRACFKAARVRSASFINFDRDAEILDGLPTPGDTDGTTSEADQAL